ncbi:MAG TPA: DUF1501 domain-containing protein [Thermoanaerobaculia bacterium]|nr:DUF1501 domain-containing protein [Thermoanaerobaculia bacterium]
MKSTRREFLIRSTCAGLTAAAAQASLNKLGLMNLYARPSAPTDYRALVCVFLDGGNDSNNMIVPTDSAHYAQYAAARPANSGIQIPQVGQPGGLISVGAPASLGGRTFGFHPALPEMASLYTQGKVAVVSNVGPLVVPVTQANIDSKPTPYSLFSHSDQIDCWQTARADQRIATGWGGRITDVTLNCNGGSGFPTITTIAGASTFCVGAGQRPLAIDTGALDQVLVLNGFNGSPQDNARKSSMDFARTIDRTATLIAAASDTTQQAVDISAALSVDPTLTTVFPGTDLGSQLQQVAKVMKLNLSSPELSLNRQIFYVETGGYDTHQDQLQDQGDNFTEFSQAMAAFYAATQELGISDRVVTFTLSDFGRTLQPSGDPGSVGTDHGWGSHHFVMGGAVAGGNFYGMPGGNGQIFPDLVVGGIDDISSDDRGRWIPATSVEQYAGTLASWFGVSALDLPVVFPLFNNFSPTTLGFLTPGTSC